MLSARSFIALRHRNFRLIWIGLLVSFSGSMMQNAALLWHVSLLVAPQRVPLAARRGFVGDISPAPLGTLELATRLPGAPQTCVLAQAKQNTRSIVINFQSISPQEV